MDWFCIWLLVIKWHWAIFTTPSSVWTNMILYQIILFFLLSVNHAFCSPVMGISCISIHRNHKKHHYIYVLCSTRSRSISPNKRFRGHINVRIPYHSPPPRDIPRSVKLATLRMSISICLSVLHLESFRTLFSMEFWVSIVFVFCQFISVVVFTFISGLEPLFLYFCFTFVCISLHVSFEFRRNTIRAIMVI